MPLHPSSQGEPALSVIVPLGDHRGMAARCLDGWRGQSAPGALFEILAVGDGSDRAIERLARQRLRAHDRLIASAGREEIALYAAAATAARGGILLFTESHCVPASDVVQVLLRFFDSSPRAVACLGSKDLATTTIARMEALLAARGEAGRSRPDWRDASLRGLAVRQEAYLEAGGFEVAFGRFAEAVLARRLQRLGYDLERVPAAVVQHANCSSLRELGKALRAHARGQAAHRERCERGTEEKMLETLPEWATRAMLAPRVARQLGRVAWASVWSDWHGPGSLARAGAALALLPKIVAAAVAGARWGLWRARLSAWVAMARCALRTRGSEERLFDAYVSAWTSLLRWGAMEYVRRQPSALTGPLIGPGRVAMGEAPDGAVAGFYAPERWSSDGAETCRWSRPFALIRLGLAPGNYRAILEIRSPLAEESRRLALFFNGRRIPAGSVRQDGNLVSFDLPQRLFALGEEQGLAIACAPFRPRSLGLPDERELGVAVFSFEASLLPA